MKEAQKEMVMSRTAVTTPLPFCSHLPKQRLNQTAATEHPQQERHAGLFSRMSSLSCPAMSTAPAHLTLPHPFLPWDTPVILLCVTQQPGLLRGQLQLLLPSLWRRRVGPKQHPQTSFSRGEFHFQKMAVSPLCQESSVQNTQPHSWHGRYHCLH